MEDNIKRLKEEIKALEKGYKLNKKQLEKKISEEKGPISARAEYVLDEIVLQICLPFERKANRIRYKRTDPRGYEADLLTEAVEPIVRHYVKRQNKGKQLSERDINLLVKIRLSLQMIWEEKLGRERNKVDGLLQNLALLMSNQTISDGPALSNILEALNGLKEQIEALPEEPVPAEVPA